MEKTRPIPDGPDNAPDDRGPDRASLKDELAAARREIASLRQAAASASQAKMDFVARMSHEIRTPLNAVIGLANLCLGTDPTLKQKDYLEKIRSSAFSLLAIVGDVMDYSGLEAEAVRLNPEPFQLQDVLDRIHERYAHEATAKGLSFSVTVAPDVPRALTGDGMRLEQVLGRLAGNAVKFTESGSVAVSASLAGLSGDRASILFRVIDTGPGMRREDIPGLFESFTQAEGYSTRRHGGAGLGLSICRRLAALMGAELEVDSEPGRGSEFRFAPSFTVRDEVEGETDLTERLRRLSVLVVDDEPVSRDMVAGYVRSFGCRAEVATSGRAALEALVAATPGFDLLIADCLMPGMDGFALVGAMRAALGTRAPTVIMISALGREEFSRKAESLSASSFLLKPVNRSLLLDAVTGAAFGGKSAAGALGPAQPARGEPGSLAGAHVLLVEDNSINRQVARELLESRGARVSEAEDGAKAVAAVGAGSYDAALMDVQMPVMDGLEATRRIRELPRGRELPIIALTAHAFAEDREKCLEAGMNDYLTKPIDPAKLFAVLAQWLEPAARSAGAPEAAATASEPAQAPPSGQAAPGVDLDSALARLAGNRKLLLNILAEFRKDYADSAREIRRLLNEDGWEEAARLAHTVKGVAGNISAEALATAARSVELTLKAGSREQTLAGLDAFERAMALTLASIGALLPAPEPAAAAPEAPRRSLNILLVDDAKLNRRVFSDLLAARGHAVRTAENGMAACAAIFRAEKNLPPLDLVLMDIEMPVMDGLKAARTIRDLLRTSAKPPCRPDLPIVALTTHEPEEALERCLAAGMNDCAHKSFDGAPLLAAIERILSADGTERPGPEARAVLAEGLPRLAAYLDVGNAEAEDLAAELRQALGQAWVEDFERIEALLGRFDFAGALETVRSLAEREGVRW